MSARTSNSVTGLVKYDAMCTAIALCASVDEAKEIRDKARALEVYAHQAMNTEAERKAIEIRLRAERRAGQLLHETKQNGQRDPGGRGRIESRPSTQLKDLGVTKDQSSEWQQLAKIPDAEFEAELRKPGKPTTAGLLHKEPTEELKVPLKALWVWGRIKDFERDGIIAMDAAAIYAGFTEAMKEDVRRILPSLIDWLRELRKECR